MSYKERAPSPPRDKQASAASHKGKEKEKAAKGKGGKDKDKVGSRPPSTQFEHSHAYWVLRVVSDLNAIVSISMYFILMKLSFSIFFNPLNMDSYYENVHSVICSRYNTLIGKHSLKIF